MLRGLKKFFVGLCFLGSCAAIHPVAFAATADPSPQVARFENQFSSLMRAWRIPGASVAVMKDNKLLYNQGFGYADMENRIPVQGDSLFRIASMSKTITAAAVLQLVQSGKIDLDSKVFQILDDLQPLPGMRINSRIYQITVRDLLLMASGWDWHGRGGFDAMFGPWPKSVAARLSQTPADCVETTRLMMGMPMQFRPGTRFAYSNLNYCILGLIVDKVTGNNYDPNTYVNYVRNQILNPLGITDMTIAHTSLSEQLPNEVRYYRYYTQGYMDTTKSGLPYSETRLLEKNYADGGWLASAPDLARFAQGLVNHTILNENMIAAMTAPPAYVPLKYRVRYFAMAWLVKPYDPLVQWMKTGSFTGANGFIVKKGDGTVYAVLFNTRPDEYAIRRFRDSFTRLVSSTNFSSSA